MNQSIHLRPAPLARSHRVAAAAAALVAGVASLGALLLAFDGASPARWAQPNAELVQRVADCEREPARAARDHCKQLLAHAAVTRTPAVTRLAQR